MITKDQIKSFDVMLKTIKSIDYSKTITYWDLMESEGYDYHKCLEIRQQLFELNLIQRIGKDNYRVVLTKHGIEAEQVGVEKYLEELENNSQLDIAVKTATISGYKSTKVLSIIAIICSVVIPVGIELFKQNSEYCDRKSYDDRGNRQEIIDSVIGQILTDSVFIEKTKYILKHDTLFLNELKLELRERQRKNKITTP